MWVDSAAAINPTFIKRSQEIYQAEVRSLDFAHDLNGASEVINQWADHKTRGHIQKIVGSLDPATVHVLTNAVYFEGAWTLPFDKSNTAPKPFYIVKDRSVMVPLMRETRRFEYLETEQFQAVRLAYKGSQLEMCIFLPRNHEYEGSGRGTLAQLTGALDNPVVKTWLETPPSMRRPGTLWFPRCELSCKRTINADLHQMGMGVAFERGAADFSLISQLLPPL